MGAGARAHPRDGAPPFKMHYSIAFEHHSIIERPPLGEILYPPLVTTNQPNLPLFPGVLLASPAHRPAIFCRSYPSSPCLRCGRQTDKPTDPRRQVLPSPPPLYLLRGLLSGRGASRYVAVASVTSSQQMVPAREARGDSGPPQMGRREGARMLGD